MANAEKYVICPYDKSHNIRISRMAYHLPKCAKQHKDKKLKQCPYDVIHLVEPSEYQHHINTCPQRESVVRYATLDDPIIQPALVPIIPHEEEVTMHYQVSKENWDEEPEVISYNPLENIENRPVIRPLIGESKSVKKQFRDRERRRIQMLDNEEERRRKQKAEAERALKAKQAAKIAALEKAEKDMKPLRRPKSLANASFEQPSYITAEAALMNGSVGEVLIIPEDPIPSDSKQNASTSAVPKSTGAIPKNTGAIPKTFSSKNSEPPLQPNISNGTSSETFPFSYARVLHKKNDETDSNHSDHSMKNTTISSDYDVVIEGEFIDTDKENISNCSFVTAQEGSIIEKLSQSIKEIAVDDDGFQKVVYKSNKNLNSYKNKMSANNALTNNKFDQKKNSTSVDKNNAGFNKRQTRVAANFSNFK